MRYVECTCVQRAVVEAVLPEFGVAGPRTRRRPRGSPARCPRPAAQRRRRVSSPSAGHGALCGRGERRVEAVDERLSAGCHGDADRHDGDEARPRARPEAPASWQERDGDHDADDRPEPAHPREGDRQGVQHHAGTEQSRPVARAGPRCQRPSTGAPGAEREDVAERDRIFQAACRPVDVVEREEVVAAENGVAGTAVEVELVPVWNCQIAIARLQHRAGAERAEDDGRAAGRACDLRHEPAPWRPSSRGASSASRGRRPRGAGRRAARRTRRTRARASIGRGDGSRPRIATSQPSARMGQRTETSTPRNEAWKLENGAATIASATMSRNGSRAVRGHHEQARADDGDRPTSGTTPGRTRGRTSRRQR